MLKKINVKAIAPKVFPSSRSLNINYVRRRKKNVRRTPRGNISHEADSLEGIGARAVPTSPLSRFPLSRGLPIEECFARDPSSLFHFGRYSLVRLQSAYVTLVCVREMWLYWLCWRWETFSFIIKWSSHRKICFKTCHLIVYGYTQVIYTYCLHLELIKF